jgi:RNA polymerase II subunit A-like phosphatase
MHLYTPPGLLYPIKVTRLLREPGSEIVENAPLFDYEYKSKVLEGVWTEKDGNVDREVERTWPATFESEFEGTLNSLSVKVGQTITGRTLVADVEEACKHEIQFGGLCADCGKDMKEVKSYNTTVKGTDRATYNTIHDRHGMHTVLVSKDETERADHEAKRRLLESRRLVLVVDLDQTVIQCCVEETIGEWKNDPSNPNYEALADVASFRLPRDDKTYYVKPRPGLKEFLAEVSQRYEMHVYTMASRDYAEHVMNLIDPDRAIFGNRVLSRDENGLKEMIKALARLFPVDTSMVAIIDDRGDVWQWVPNLVKVKAYDFFVGVGDINSSFLPKQHVIEAAKPAKAQAENTAKTDAPKTANNEVTPPNDTDKGNKPVSSPSSVPMTAAGANGEVVAVDLMVSMAGNEDDSTLEEKKHEQDEALANQLAERPLLQKQKILDAAEEEAKDVKESPAVEEATEILKEDGLAKKETTPTDHPKYRHNLLQDDDTELEHLGKNLLGVHKAFFEQYEQELPAVESGRVAELRPGQHKKPDVHDVKMKIPDVAVIMHGLKSRVLGDVHLVFSGVVPLGVNIHTYDTAIWAKSFGATVSENITKKTTHVIASPERRTAKVRLAAKKGGRISIVNSGWLFACFSQWSKVDEGPYRIHSDAPANGQPALPDSFEDKELGTLSASDEEAALTEAEAEDEGGREVTNGTHLSLDIDTDEEELAKYAPQDGREDGSPTEEQRPDDWDSIDAELADFIGDSDVEDSDAPDASESESESDAGKNTANSTPSSNKRKRDATANDVPPTSDPEEGSRLQKRKKEALSRTTSLTNMASVTGGTVSAVGPSEPAKLDGVDEAEDEEEDEDDADLEAALAAEMEKDEDDGGEADGET